jgi:hypothetical protein
MTIACEAEHQRFFGDNDSEDEEMKWEVLICHSCGEVNIIQHSSSSLDEHQVDAENWVRPTRTEYLYPASRRATSEGIFFAGQQFDALKLVADLLSQARNTITIIDGYIGEQLLDLLTTKPPAVDVKILTKARSASAALVAKAAAFNRQYGNLSVRTSEAFHDRFLILDDHDFYHFGASMDQRLGRRGFMFSRVEEPDVVNALRAKLAQEWAGSRVSV